MMNNQKKLFFSRLWKVLLFTFLVVFGLAAGFDFYYDLNDDTTIKDILSGAYTGTPSGYSIQMLYPLGILIAVCYRAIPGVAWYGLFLCLCQFGVFALIAFRLTRIFHKQKMQLLALTVETILFVGLLFRELVMVQYSITSAVCMAGALFLYVTGEIRETTAASIKENFVPVGLVILSFTIRTEVCMMLLPFLVLAGLARLVLDPVREKITKFDIVRRNFFLVLLAMLGMLVMLGLDSLAVHLSPVGQNWQRFQNFFDARTKLYDFYEMPNYTENRAFYEEIGLSRESYELLQNYNFSLDESIDEHLLEEIANYVEAQAGVSNQLTSYFGKLYTKKNIREGIWLYKNHLLTGQNGFWGIFILLLYGVNILLCLQCRYKIRWLQFGKLFILTGIRSMLWLYLFMVDRVLDRVTIPLLLVETVLLLGWLFAFFQTYPVMQKQQKWDMAWSEKHVQMVTKTICFILVLCGFGCMWYNGTRAYREYLKREQINPRWEAFLQYCDYFSEDYFVMDVYSSTSYEGISYSEKMFQNVDNAIKNYDICGGWLAKSPLMKEKLKKYGISNIETALRQNESNQHQVYFVAACDQDLGWLYAYYMHKGQKIQLEQVDTIWYQNDAIFAVYEIVPQKDT